MAPNIARRKRPQSPSVIAVYYTLCLLTLYHLSVAESRNNAVGTFREVTHGATIIAAGSAKPIVAYQFPRLQWSRQQVNQPKHYWATPTSIFRRTSREHTFLQSSASSHPLQPSKSPSFIGFDSRRQDFLFQTKTLFRVMLPSLFSGLIAFASFPALTRGVVKFVTSIHPTAKMALVGDASSLVSNFLSLVGLLYSILVGQVFGFLYGQQEALYLSLFDEVTEAKSLLEQVALVSQGRTMYFTCLSSIARYVRDDLRGGTTSSSKINSPSMLLSTRPADDPLETILYLTSVGVPGHIYDTVRSLRQARSRRLGALQRKVPLIHLVLLWVLAIIMLLSFPCLVGVSGDILSENFIKGNNLLSVQGGLFGVATFAVVMTKMVLAELWRTTGGAYNVDTALSVMVKGLEVELEERIEKARKITNQSNKELL